MAHDVKAFCHDAFESLLQSMTGTVSSPANTHGQVLQKLLHIPAECDTLFPIQSMQKEYQNGFLQRCDQMGLKGTEALNENVPWNASFELAAVCIGYTLNPALSQQLYHYLPLRRRVQYRLGQSAAKSTNTYDTTWSSISYINAKLSQMEEQKNIL